MSLFVMTGGVEWDIAVPLRAIPLFGPVGEETEVFTWLHHFEDGMRLYGFPSASERRLFLDLVKVEGIGPRQALKILSGIAPQELALALEQGDLKALQKVSGVGPKLAQKMVLALKGQLVELAEGTAAGAASRNASPWSDVITALVDMGYDRKAVEAAVRKNADSVAASEDRKRNCSGSFCLTFPLGVRGNETRKLENGSSIRSARR